MNIFFEKLDKITSLIAESMFLLIVIFVFFAAVVRWFGYPVAWSVDLAKLLFVWVSFFGANIALMQEKHIGVDYFINKMPEQLKHYIMIFRAILIFVFLSFIAYYGFKLSYANYTREYQSLHISYSWATICAPLVSMLMILTILNRLYQLVFSNKIKKERSLSKKVLI